MAFGLHALPHRNQFHRRNLRLHRLHRIERGKEKGYPNVQEIKQQEHGDHQLLVVHWFLL